MPWEVNTSLKTMTIIHSGLLAWSGNTSACLSLTLAMLAADHGVSILFVTLSTGLVVFPVL